MLRTYFQEQFYDMPVDIAQKYAEGIRMAILAGTPFDNEKKKGFYLSKNRGFEDKLYVGNIHRIENHLYWNDEELADDDEIINVVMLDGPVTRDGDGCSYGSKDHRDQILYANTIPQVKGHIFIINTPGGAASARIDYEQAIADCREKGKPTVAWVDGMCCSAGQLVAALCDRTIVMNGRHTMGCIGTMCAFWGVANGTVDKDGYRYIELVSVTSPDKNAEYREACDGKTEKLQAELDKLGEEFRETVRQNRPLVKEEHLTGKTFDADSVMGTLVDEIGDYTRAIEAVFELAGGTLTPAREATVVPDEPGGEAGKSEEQKDLATLNGQQKQALAASSGDLMMVEDGHLKTEVQTIFGPEEKEVATPKNNNDMTEEEKKAAEVAEQPAATQESPSNPSEGGGQPATEQPAEKAPATEAPAKEEPVAAEEPSEGAPAGEQPANEEAAGQEEALAAAEALVAERDKEIAELKESLAALEGIAEERDAAIRERNDISASLEKAGEDYAEQNKALAAAEAKVAEKDAAIEKLTKQVNDLKAEVKELSEKPTPMVSEESGIPANNGTGEAPKQKPRIQSGMSYEEIRKMQKEGK